MGKNGYNNTSIQKGKVTAFDIAEVHPPGGYIHKDGAYKQGGSKHQMNKYEKLVAEALALIVVLYSGHELLKTKTARKYTNNVIDPIDGFMIESGDFIWNQVKDLPGFSNRASEKTINAVQKSLAPTPAPTVANGSAVKETEAYEFTPGIEIIGSDAYKEHIEAQLEELDKTPNFKIRGMTARQYVEKYLDYLYEAVPGTLENCPKEAYGKKATECLAINFSEASILLHVARHADQFSGELREEFKDKPIYDYEKDAVTVQVNWVAEKFNLTETKKNELFESLMKKYKP